MNVIATLHTADVRGDHATDVCRIVDIRDGETVEQLCKRLFRNQEQCRGDDARLDTIEMKQVN